jgi:transposase
LWSSGGSFPGRARPRIDEEIGDITRFPAPSKLVGYTGLCRRVYQSGKHGSARPALQTRTPVSALGARWALIDAAAHASRHPLFQARYQQITHRVGRQRGAKVAQVDLWNARRLTEAIWQTLTEK